MASENDIRNAHRADFGNTLVGAAQIDPNSIQWVGATSPISMNLNTSNAAFGFTGAVTYQGEGVQANQWQFELATRMIIGGPTPGGSSPAIGLYFAPSTPEATNASVVSTVDGFRKQVAVRGTGIADDSNNPALTLEIDVRGETSIQACNDASLYCEEVEMPLEGTLTFAVTPKVNASLLPAGVPIPEYVMIAVTASEQNTQSSGADFAFFDRNPQNNFNPAQYFQTLTALGPNQMESSPFRTYAYIAKIGSTFEFYVDNKRPSNSGHIEYQFRLAGHYNFNQPNLWPGSHKTFRVRSTAAAPEWPALGSASVMNPIGAVQSAPAGVGVSGGVLAVDSNTVIGTGGIVKAGTNVRIGGKIGVFPGLENQTVDVLIVKGYQANPTMNAALSYKTASGQYLPWTGQPVASIEAVTSTALSKALSVSIFEGVLNDDPGIYSYYIGYRISSGAVIFSGAPINFNVVV